MQREFQGDMILQRRNNLTEYAAIEPTQSTILVIHFLLMTFPIEIYIFYYI